MQFCGVTHETCLTNNQTQYETRMNTCSNAQFTRSKDPPLQARFPLPHLMNRKHSFHLLLQVLCFASRYCPDLQRLCFRSLPQNHSTTMREKLHTHPKGSATIKYLLTQICPCTRNEAMWKGARSGGVARLIRNVDIAQA
jgi:hypothetical protein